jgi:hypothetical protein
MAEKWKKPRLKKWKKWSKLEAERGRNSDLTVSNSLDKSRIRLQKLP